jgi:hypothetical protein
VTKLLAKLPGWIAAAEEKFPSILRQIGKFVDDIKGVGKSADGLLGPGGSITLLVTGIGAAFGGLRGAIATNLLKGGVDPIKAYFIATVGAGVLQGVTDGLMKSLTSAAVTKFMALFKNIPVSVAPTGGVPGVPVPVKPGAPGVPPVVPAAGGLAAFATLAAGLSAVAAIPTAIVVGIQQSLIGTAREDERRRNGWTEAQQTLFYEVLRDQQKGMTAFAQKQKYGESAIAWVNANSVLLNKLGVAYFANNQNVGTTWPTMNTTVTVKVGDKGIDDVVSSSVTRLGIPGAPNKY